MRKLDENGLLSDHLGRLTVTLYPICADLHQSAGLLRQSEGKAPVTLQEQGRVCKTSPGEYKCYSVHTLIA